MRRTLNIKLVLFLLGSLVLAGGAIYFIHEWQVTRSARHLLELADRAAADAEHAKPDSQARSQADARAETYYAQYLTFVPNDIAAIKRYVQVLDRRATPARRDEVIAHMEEVLRARPDDHALRMRLVHNLMLVDRVGDAIANLKKLLPHWDDKAELYHMLACCQALGGENDAAMDSFREAIKLSPQRLSSYARLTEVLQDRLKKRNEAAQVMDDMVSQNPKSWEAHLLRSRFLRAHNEKAADADLQTALKLGPKEAAVTFEAASIQVARAEAAALDKQYQRAQTMLNQARADYPNEIMVVSAQADLAMMQGKWADAEKIIANASSLEQFAHRVELQLARVRLWTQRGTPDDLAQLAQLSESTLKAQPSDDRVRLARTLADTWYRLGNWERAERFWQTLARDLPAELQARVYLLELTLQKGDIVTARRWHTEIRRIEGEQGPLTRFGMAAILVKEAQGDRTKLETARKLIRDLRAEHDSPRLTLLSAATFEMEGQYQKAIAEYSRALRQGEIQPGTMARLLELLIERRDFSKAEIELSFFTRKQPLTKPLARLGTEIAIGAGGKQAKEAVLARARVAVPLPSRDYRDYLWLTHVHQSIGVHDEAEKYAREAVHLAPHVADTWVALIEQLERAGQHAQAVQELERLKKALPAARQPLAVARSYEAMRLTKEATQAYDEALRQRPDDANLLAAAADFHRRGDRDEQARTLYARLLKPELAASPTLAVNARRQLAILLARQGDATARTKGLALLNENTRARGETLADERVGWFVRSHVDADRKTYLQRFQESTQQHRPTPDEQLLLAQMLEASDQLMQARTLLGEVVDQHPTQAQYLARYVGVLIKTEDWDDAQRMLTRLEGLEPSGERVHSLKQALAAKKAS